MGVRSLLVNMEVAKFQSILNKFEFFLSADQSIDKLSDNVKVNEDVRNEITVALFVRIIDTYNFFIASVFEQILSNYFQLNNESKKIIDALIVEFGGRGELNIEIINLINKAHSQNRKLYKYAAKIGFPQIPEIEECVNLRNDLVHNGDILREEVPLMQKSLLIDEKTFIPNLKKGERVELSSHVFGYALEWLRRQGTEIDTWTFDFWHLEGTRIEIKEDQSMD